MSLLSKKGQCIEWIHCSLVSALLLLKKADLFALFIVQINGSKMCTIHCSEWCFTNRLHKILNYLNFACLHYILLYLQKWTALVAVSLSWLLQPLNLLKCQKTCCLKDIEAMLFQYIEIENERVGPSACVKSVINHLIKKVCSVSFVNI